MYHWMQKLTEPFRRASVTKTEENPLSKDMVIPVRDLTLALKSFINPRDVNRHSHTKNGLQLAAADVLIAVRHALDDHQASRYFPLQYALITLENSLMPDEQGMVTIPRQSLQALQTNMYAIENAAHILKHNPHSFGCFAAATKGRAPHQLIDEARQEIIDPQSTADALVKLADNLYIFFANHDPSSPQEPAQPEIDGNPPKGPALRSPRPKFLGGIPRK